MVSQLTQVQAENLESLRHSVVPLAQPEDQLVGAQQSWTLNVSLLGRLLLFETAGQRPGETDVSLKSNTLTPKPKNIHLKTDSSVEFNLIGSMGISGHQSVPKDTPISAPLTNDQSNHSDTADLDFFASMAPDFSNMRGAYEYQGLTSDNGAEIDSSMFLPAIEYGRSIGDWLGNDLL